MALEPKPGLVIRYDYLWRDEAQAGRESGKDRPSAIILMSKPGADGSQLVRVCPITHVPPSPDQTAVEIPYKVAKHLQLDDDRMWIKTNELNEFIWVPGRLPFGVVPTRDGREAYGQLPQQLGKAAFDQVRENATAKALHRVNRDDQEDTAYRDRLQQQRDRFKERGETDAPGGTDKDKKGNKLK